MQEHICSVSEAVSTTQQQRNVDTEIRMRSELDDDDSKNECININKLFGIQ